jgi:hypothetical protein
MSVALPVRHSLELCLHKPGPTAARAQAAVAWARAAATFRPSGPLGGLKASSLPPLAGATATMAPAAAAAAGE